MTVTRNDAAGRYEIHVGDVLGGFTEFRVDSRGRLVFPHTSIDPAFAGRGLGAVLVGDAMKDAVARHETVVPECPYVVRFLQKHEVEGLEIDWSRSGTAGTGAAAGGSGV
ncbi:N-acetyltransferase [Microbacterium rhizomatis]|uniref:N-acetyltransferase n=1 Tax=Microbacterium rhizomatis TaxID=1631477 RepID=A0A5J5J296_9MICO|nr:N-acetyltransferase [Microbacterium rhizomatis]